MIIVTSHLYVLIATTDLMKAAPDLMMSALLTHNNLIQKAKWTNFGSIIEQEGDSYAIIFEDAGDAVKFCLQASSVCLGIPCARVFQSGLSKALEDSIVVCPNICWTVQLDWTCSF